MHSKAKIIGARNMLIDLVMEGNIPNIEIERIKNLNSFQTIQNFVEKHHARETDLQYAEAFILIACKSLEKKSFVRRLNNN